MKKFSEKILMTVILLTVISFAGNSQTYVSGGIFSNTTWTFSNSPYVVTGNVVVFPGFILTIEPGVIIKFDNNQQLEIRQSTLIAEGTPTDSIIFTSNSMNPSAGIWNDVYLNGSHTSKLNYCSFTYAYEGIDAIMAVGDTLTLKNSNSYNNSFGMRLSGKCFIDSCNIFNNNWGFEGCSNGCVINYCRVFNNQYDGIIISTGTNTVTNCNISCNGQFGIKGNQNSTSLVENCLFEYNQIIGIESQGSMKVYNCIFQHNNYGFGFNAADSITHCLFQYNKVGFLFNGSGGVIINNIFEFDSIGILIANSANVISCNTIQNSTAYAVKYTPNNNSNCVTNNYWGTTDSVTIASMIYDGYDNAAYGLLSFIPFYTAPCPNIGPVPFSFPSGCSLPLSVNESLSKQSEVNIFPNPFSDKISITTKSNESFEINFYDITARKIFNQKFTNSTSINTSQLAKGIYFYEVRNENGVVKKGKVVKE